MKNSGIRKVRFTRKDKVQEFFKRHTDIAGVIHFMASKQLVKVWKTHCCIMKIISIVCLHSSGVAAKNRRNLIFSSSCTVYGQAEIMPITEDALIQAAMSPYGNTKQIGEEIINDVAKVTNVNAILLRYFNPIGSHLC
jgi:UDP-glucose 4-epimerase